EEVLLLEREELGVDVEIAVDAVRLDQRAHCVGGPRGARRCVHRRRQASAWRASVEWSAWPCSSASAASRSSRSVAGARLEPPFCTAAITVSKLRTPRACVSL